MFGSVIQQQESFVVFSFIQQIHFNQAVKVPGSLDEIVRASEFQVARHTDHAQQPGKKAGMNGLNGELPETGNRESRQARQQYQQHGDMEFKMGIKQQGRCETHKKTTQCATDSDREVKG